MELDAKKKVSVFLSIQSSWNGITNNKYQNKHCWKHFWIFVQFSWWSSVYQVLKSFFYSVFTLFAQCNVRFWISMVSLQSVHLSLIAYRVRSVIFYRISKYRNELDEHFVHLESVVIESSVLPARLFFLHIFIQFKGCANQWPVVMTNFLHVCSRFITFNEKLFLPFVRLEWKSILLSLLLLWKNQMLRFQNDHLFRSARVLKYFLLV